MFDPDENISVPRATLEGLVALANAGAKHASTMEASALHDVTTLLARHDSRTAEQAMRDEGQPTLFDTTPYDVGPTLPSPREKSEA